MNIRDFVIRRKIKKGKCLTDEQELRLFGMPDRVELLGEYLKHWPLTYEDKLLAVGDKNLFELYCSEYTYLKKKKIIDRIFTDVSAPYFQWRSICAKYCTLSPENEVKLVTSEPYQNLTDYIRRRQLSPTAELAMFSNYTIPASDKRLYVEEKKYLLYNATISYLLASENPLDVDLMRSYMSNYMLDEEIHQIALVKKHNLELLTLYFKKNETSLCRGAQTLLLGWGDPDALAAFVEYQPFWNDAEVAFVKDADSDLLEKYVIKYQLCEVAEIVFIERNNARLIKAYLRNHQFCDHAWQYYISLMN